jgi:hypothetical protein
MNISNHLSSQLATERQRDLRHGGARRARTSGEQGARAPRLARIAALRGAIGWRRRRTRQARGAERVGC